MPGLDFTLPHWLYWIGLIVFPIVAMSLGRRPKPTERLYSVPLAYMIWITGGIIGLHRLYLRNLWGLLFIPVFLFILIANSQQQDARSLQSDATNQLRMAERVITREEERVTGAEADLPGLRAELETTEEGSFARRSVERRIERAEQGIESGRQKLEQAREEAELARPLVDAATRDRTWWAAAAKYAFYLIVALLVIDAFLLPMLVRRANERLPRGTEVDEFERTAAAAAAATGEARRDDRDLAENWIDRLSLFCGEFVSYWAVIAVFVYYYEVISRYVFNSPTNWAHEAMYLMFGMQYLIAGSYAMLTESHVRVDVFYAPLPRKKKAWVDLFTSVFFFIFAGTLLFTCWTFAMDAIAVPSGNAVVSDWARGQVGFGEALANWNLGQWTDPNIRWGEISFNEWEVPLWPMKWVMVMGAALLVLQGVSKFAKDIRAIARGE
ncbi:TRAP transporter small permease subunit [Pseudooceanicola sp. LIPI14-2-Ac024]|uniref:TRAP transporter small permease subunit n=1 Tax=Pseudooceanicola sp. LIPI14-2-Ac024 TaxID=3344875 RepID=UPI0035CFA9C6